MNLVKELDKIQEATISEFENENYDMDAMQKLAFDYTGNAVATQVSNLESQNLRISEIFEILRF